MAAEAEPRIRYAGLVRTDAHGGTQEEARDIRELTPEFDHRIISITRPVRQAVAEFEAGGGLVVPEKVYPDDGMEKSAQVIRGILQRAGVDIIVSYQHPATRIAKDAGEVLNVPVVVRERAWPDTSSPQAENEMEAIAAASHEGAFNRIIYASHFSRAEHENYGVNPRGAMVVPMGIDLQRFKRNGAERERIRRALGLDDSDMLVGVPISLDRPDKDPDAALEAITWLIRECEREGSRIPHFAFAGLGLEPDNEKWVAKLEERNVTPYGHLLGPLPQADMPGFCSAADVVLQTSRKEGMARVLLEALACGALVVATDVGDHRRTMGPVARLRPPRGNAPLAEWAGAKVLACDLLEMRQLLANPDARDERIRAGVDLARQYDREKYAAELGEVVLTEFMRGRSAPWN